MAGVRVADGDCLVFICEVSDNALGKDVEMSAEQDVVGRGMDDMDL